LTAFCRQANGNAPKKLSWVIKSCPATTLRHRNAPKFFSATTPQHLYLAFHAYDREPGAIRARMARRDNVFEDDYVAVFLDTFNDRRRAYALYFNPFGVQADGIFHARRG
jgi:hypothetical protein